MNWSDISGALGKVAPMLGSLAGGPVTIAAAVGSMVASALGVPNSPDAVHAALIADPEAAVKMAQIESDQKVKLQELTVTAAANDLAAQTAEVQAALQDRISARQREVETKDDTPKVLAGLIILGWFALEWFVCTHVVPEASRSFVERGFGMLDMAVGLVLNYYFGSSVGSKRKTELMAKQTPAVEPNAING